MNKKSKKADIEKKVEFDNEEIEFQVGVTANLQALISQIVDKTNYDPISVTAFIHQLSGFYLEQMKSEWKLLCADREKYETELKKDIETLIEEV